MVVVEEERVLRGEYDGGADVGRPRDVESTKRDEDRFARGHPDDERVSSIPAHAEPNGGADEGRGRDSSADPDGGADGNRDGPVDEFPLSDALAEYERGDANKDSNDSDAR